MVFIGCVLGVYDNWEKQVDKFINFQTQNTCHIKINGM